jgi:TonB family protein
VSRAVQAVGVPASFAGLALSLAAHAAAIGFAGAVAASADRADAPPSPPSAVIAIDVSDEPSALPAATLPAPALAPEMARCAPADVARPAVAHAAAGARRLAPGAPAAAAPAVEPAPTSAPASGAPPAAQAAPGAAAPSLAPVVQAGAFAAPSETGTAASGPAANGGGAGAPSGRSAGGPPSAAPGRGDGDMPGFLRDLSGRIARRVAFPDEAARASRQGTVVLRLVLAADGGLRDARVVAGDADDVLRAAALRAVESARPFPAPPAGVLEGGVVALQVPLRFVLRD